MAGKLCLEAAHTEIEGIVERERRRECYRRIATVDGDGIGPFVLIEILRKILDTVAGECGVGAPVEPADGLVLSLKLDTHTVGMRSVHTQRISGVGNLAGDDKLVLIVHIIEIDSGREAA